MNALVTGGTGFLGGHLVRALLAEGASVRILSRTPGGAGGWAEGTVERIAGDITDRDAVRGILTGVDTVFHLAAQMGAWGVPRERYEVLNVRGTEHLLEESLRAGVGRFVLASTPGVQGKGHAAAVEDLPYNPPHHYERTKCEAEKRCLRTGRETGLPVTIVRPDFVYGPGDKRRLALYRSVYRRRFFIVGDGRSVLHPTYVDDAVRGFMLAAARPAAEGQIYNIAGPARMSVHAYLAAICRTLDVPFPAFRIPRTLAVAAARLWEASALRTGREPLLTRSRIDFLTCDHGSDITKARLELGYQPLVDFPQGIQETMEWCLRMDLLS